MLVRMVSHITGGRHDGRPWPDGGEVIDVPDWEGEDLIRGRMASPVDDDTRKAWEAEHGVSAHSRAAKAAQARAAEAAEAAAAEVAMSPPDPRAEVDPRAPEFEPPAGEDSPAEAPLPSAPKQEWIDYAVSTGTIDVHGAQAMTKADLMSRFGGRL